MMRYKLRSNDEAAITNSTKTASLFCQQSWIKIELGKMFYKSKKKLSHDRQISQIEIGPTAKGGINK